MADHAREQFVLALRSAIERGSAVAAEQNMVATFNLRREGLAVVVTGGSKQGAESFVRMIPWSQLESDEEFTLEAAVAGAVKEAVTDVEGILREVR